MSGRVGERVDDSVWVDLMVRWIDGSTDRRTYELASLQFGETGLASD